jgi:hypothetical protein
MLCSTSRVSNISCSRDISAWRNLPFYRGDSCNDYGMRLCLALVLGWSGVILSLGEPAPVDFAEANLRGYGAVSGRLQFYQPAGATQPGSILTLTCLDEEKAKLTLAKFLSDAQEISGPSRQDLKANQWGLGSLKFGGTALSGYEVPGNGWLTGLRLGSKVLLAAAPTREGLVAEINDALAGNKEMVVSQPEAQVPMWLDRFDKHGFRFYYGPGTKPPGQENEEYDVRQDFAFAHDHDVGMVFWNPLSLVMGADGQTDRTSWDWAEGWAKQDSVPVAINLSSLNYDIPSWMANRYRDQMMLTMPGYLGDSMSVANGRGTSGKVGEVAWGATDARDMMLAALQASARKFNLMSNVVSWLEPHNELSQAGDDFMGYGPATDVTFREYLKQHYSGPDKVSHAWFGNADTLKSWDDIHTPELATFLGWGLDALDLAGTWRVNFMTDAPSPDWFTPGFDDSKWLTVTAPGDDRNMFLPKQLAVFRRTFDLPADWLAKHGKVWIYLWDLNLQRSDKQLPVTIMLNGQKVAESLCLNWHTHWMAADATAFLKPGPNQIALQLPLGYLGYRIYLSGSEPKQYPNLGEGLNTEWTDLVGWRQWTRIESVRRGMEMIREVDPNRGITLMAPTYAQDGVKGLAQQYGGEFHDTGFMAGCWADLLPCMMRSSNLPCSDEPGGPAPNITEFRKYFGRWHTEGLQQIDYFIHIGDVMWHPEIRKEFEEQLPLIHLFGKYHEPKADLAFLFSTGGDALTGYPWTNDLNTNLPGGWFCCGMFGEVMNYCDRDAVSESDFARGNAAAYKVILDTNTSIMDDDFVSQIEKYVRDGGVFVTFVNSGRPSPNKRDTWPISRLTGYDVLSLEQFDDQGHTLEAPNPKATPAHLTLQPAAGQTIYQAEDWMKLPYYNGLRLKKVAADAQDLLTWSDGTVAVGMRKIGKGAIIEFGCKGGGQPWLGIDTAVFHPIFKMAGVKPNTIDVNLDKPSANLRDYTFRHYVSNNGLYDISVIWNNTEAPIKATLNFKENAPAWARDVRTGQEMPVQNGKLPNLALDPLETRIFISPRGRIANAAADWFTLQRGWWHESAPVTKPFPKLSDRFMRDLNDGWSFHPLADKEDLAPEVVPGFNDSAWPKISTGSWSPDPHYAEVKHALMRRAFTVPEEWKGGRVELWIQCNREAFTESGIVWLDGKVIHSGGSESNINGLAPDGGFAPGSTHELAVEIQSKGTLAGLTGDVWLDYIPAPASTIDLAGAWTTCKDDLFHDTGSVTWPGDYEAKSLWRNIDVPKENEGKTVMLAISAQRPFQTFVNGTRVEYSDRPWADSRCALNITPWIHFGQPNRIQVVSTYGKGNVKRVALDFYAPGSYP